MYLKKNQCYIPDYMKHCKLQTISKTNLIRSAYDPRIVTLMVHRNQAIKLKTQRFIFVSLCLIQIFSQ